MANEDVVQKLDTIIAILKLAHREEIEAARGAIRKNDTSAAVLDGARTWTPAGKLKTAVMKKTGAGATTFTERVSDLLQLGVLEKQGGGPTTQYKTTGLI